MDTTQWSWSVVRLEATAPLSRVKPPSREDYVQVSYCVAVLQSLKYPEIITVLVTEQERFKTCTLDLAWDPTVSYHLFVNIKCNN